jgi:membrane-bound ClpP family serine protease
MTALIFALLVTGASLLIAEAHVVSYGVLGAAGVAALAAAVILAVESAGGSVVIALAVAVPLALMAIALVALTARRLVRLATRPAKAGLVGSVGVVRHDVAPVGDVLVDGELWRARRSWVDDELALGEGEHVVVERVHGLTLSVRRAEEWEMLP